MNCKLYQPSKHNQFGNFTKQTITHSTMNLIDSSVDLAILDVFNRSTKNLDLPILDVNNSII